MSGKRILIVEDDPDSRTMLCMMVQALGYEHLAFSGGAEALAGIEGHTFSLAFLDVMMPGMNGYELLEQLRKTTQFATTPIIMVTAKDQDSDVLEGYKLGADYYIPKPYNLEQIKYGIQTFMEE